MIFMAPLQQFAIMAKLKKKIPWSAFALTERDWEQIADVRDILKVL